MPGLVGYNADLPIKEIRPPDCSEVRPHTARGVHPTVATPIYPATTGRRGLTSIPSRPWFWKLISRLRLQPRFASRNHPTAVA